MTERPRIALTAVGLAITVLSVLPAAAQTPPPLIADRDGVVHVGQLSGLDVWSVPGEPRIFAAAPNGRLMFSGRIHGPDGADVSAALAGLEPEPFSVPAAGATVPDATAPDAVATRDAGGDDLAQEARRALGPQGLQAAQDLISRLPESVRREVFVDLIQRIRDADDIDTFETAILEWRGDVEVLTRAAGGTGESDLETALAAFNIDDAGGIVDALPPASGAEGADGMTDLRRNVERALSQAADADLPAADTGPAAVASAVPPEAGEMAAPGNDPHAALLDEMRQDGFWFSIGAMDAPVAYAVIDPSCPHCARAMQSLQPAVENGDLQLRVLLAPVLGERARGLTAAILNAEQPPRQFWEHELEKAAAGRSSMSVQDYETVDDPLQAGVAANVDILRDNGISGVPFFVFDTPDGARTISGVATPEEFAAATTDDYTGIAAR